MWACGGHHRERVTSIGEPAGPVTAILIAQDGPGGPSYVEQVGKRSIRHQHSTFNAQLSTSRVLYIPGGINHDDRAVTLTACSMSG